VYGVMIYFMEPVDEFAIVNHPWQPLFLHAHILTAPLLVFGFGFIWYDHAWAFFRSDQKEGRRSGSSLLGLAVPMILSGYAIQVSVTESWRGVWVWVHVVTASVWVIGYLVHVTSHILARRKRAAMLHS